MERYSLQTWTILPLLQASQHFQCGKLCVWNGRCSCGRIGTAHQSRSDRLARQSGSARHGHCRQRALRLGTERWDAAPRWQLDDRDDRRQLTDDYVASRLSRGGAPRRRRILGAVRRFGRDHDVCRQRRSFAQGNPIFAISGDDHLTGSSGDDLFVFAQPIGQDVVYNFDAAHDKIDLIAFTGMTSYPTPGQLAKTLAARR